MTEKNNHILYALPQILDMKSNGLKMFAIFGMLAVALGAFGAHGLKSKECLNLFWKNDLIFHPWRKIGFIKKRLMHTQNWGFYEALPVRYIRSQILQFHRLGTSLADWRPDSWVISKKAIESSKGCISIGDVMVLAIEFGGR